MQTKPIFFEFQKIWKLLEGHRVTYQTVWHGLPIVTIPLIFRICVFLMEKYASFYVGMDDGMKKSCYFEILFKKQKCLTSLYIGYILIFFLLFLQTSTFSNNCNYIVHKVHICRIYLVKEYMCNGCFLERPPFRIYILMLVNMNI